jgi:hypothetical protein
MTLLAVALERLLDGRAKIVLLLDS